MKLQRGALLTVALLVSPVVLAAALEETVLSLTRDLKVHASGEASLSVTPVGTLMAGNLPDGMVLGHWSAEVTAGTVAYRFNPGLVDEATAQPYIGQLARNDEAAQVHAALSTTQCPTSRIEESADGKWVVCPEGQAVTTGLITLYQNQRVLSGSYLVAIDTVVWGF